MNANRIKVPASSYNSLPRKNPRPLFTEQTTQIYRAIIHIPSTALTIDLLCFSAEHKNTAQSSYNREREAGISAIGSITVVSTSISSKVLLPSIGINSRVSQRRRFSRRGWRAAPRRFIFTQGSFRERHYRISRVAIASVRYYFSKQWPGGVVRPSGPSGSESIGQKPARLLSSGAIATRVNPIRAYKYWANVIREAAEVSARTRISGWNLCGSSTVFSLYFFRAHARKSTRDGYRIQAVHYARPNGADFHLIH